MTRSSGASGLAMAALLLAMTAAPVAAQGPAPARVVVPTDRTVLPIPEPRYPHSTVFDVRTATPPPRFEVKAPAKAPNVLIVLIDDMGFGQSSAFGGPISMPTVERLARQGFRYNEFHTTALAAAQWVQHRGLRQVPRDRGLGGQPLGPDRSLADPLRLRQVRRLHRRRDQAGPGRALRRLDLLREGRQADVYL